MITHGFLLWGLSKEFLLWRITKGFLLSLQFLLVSFYPLKIISICMCVRCVFTGFSICSICSSFPLISFGGEKPSSETIIKGFLLMRITKGFPLCGLQRDSNCAALQKDSFCGILQKDFMCNWLQKDSFMAEYKRISFCGGLQKDSFCGGVQRDWERTDCLSQNCYRNHSSYPSVLLLLIPLPHPSSWFLFCVSSWARSSHLRLWTHGWGWKAWWWWRDQDKNNDGIKTDEG